MKRLFISTTNNVENGKAISYYGVVSSHLVAGTGFLSDFAASFSDFFGGRSGSYRRQMESLYDEALDELSDKARQLGANAVLGLKIDMDNISGKGMSMFMITAVGTAAKIEFSQDTHEDGRSETVTSTALMHELAKREILKNLNDKDAILPQKSWEYILRSPDVDYLIPLTNRYFNVVKHSNDYDSSYYAKFVENYGLYLQMTQRDLAVNAVYQGMYDDDYSAIASDLIKDHQLFDAKEILKLVQAHHLRRAVNLLNTEQPAYTESDLKDIETLIAAFDSLPDLGKIELVKSGMFGKETEKYICRHGHQNAKEEEYCLDCRENIKGLTFDDQKSIEEFKQKAAVLKEMLSIID